MSDHQFALSVAAAVVIGIMSAHLIHKKWISLTVAAGCAVLANAIILKWC